MTRNNHSGQYSGAVLRGVSKKYQRSAALTDVDLTLAPGEHVAILGRSGSGKSTLLNMLTGIDRPTSGTIRYWDLEIKGFVAHVQRTTTTLYYDRDNH